MSTLAAALSGIAILLVGGGIGYYFGRLGRSASDARRDELQEEFDAYRADVAEHFGKTADQFHAIGLQYRELYEHLAAGSAALCQLEPPADSAPFPPAIEAKEATAGSDLSGSEADEKAPAVEAEPGETVTAGDSPPPDHADDEEPAVAAAEGDAEPAPDNVVELVPRTGTEDETDKQTVS